VVNLPPTLAAGLPRPILTPLYDAGNAFSKCHAWDKVSDICSIVCTERCVAVQSSVVVRVGVLRSNPLECLSTWDEWRQVTSSPCQT
jgi:hypothetical protein